MEGKFSFYASKEALDVSTKICADRGQNYGIHGLKWCVFFLQMSGSQWDKLCELVHTVTEYLLLKLLGFAVIAVLCFPLRELSSLLA